MKILMVGGQQFKHEAERYYSYTNMLANGFIKLGHHVQHFSDRDVARNSNLFRRKKTGVKKCNKILLEYVADYLPDIIIFKHADVIYSETVLRIRELYPHIKLAQLNIDALFNPDNVVRIRNKSGLVDANFITTAGKAAQKCKVNDKPFYFLPNIVDSSILPYKSFEQDKNKFDIFFACGAAYDGELRKEIKNYVRDELPNATMAYHCLYEKTDLWGSAYIDRLGQSTIGLNFSRYDERGRKGEDEDYFIYSSDRLSHYIGNGLLVFSDAKFCLDEIYTEQEMVFFNSKEELMEKLRYYLDRPQEAQTIAKAGYKKSMRDYSSTKAAAFMMDVLCDKPIQDYAWPTDAV